MPAIQPTRRPDDVDAAVRRRDQKRLHDARRNASVAKIVGDAKYLFGERPAVADPERRRRASESLLYWLTGAGYFPDSVGRSLLCDEQLSMVARLERCINEGTPTVHAGFRGSAKSAITELAALWAILTARRRFVGWYGCTSNVAKLGIRSLLMELEENDRLAADWPDACWLFRALEGSIAKSKGQRYDGAPTQIKCSTTEIVIPFVNDAGKVARWACVVAKGLNAQDAARGLRWKSPHGENLRPDMAVVDDPQSRRSAMSGTQVYDRIKLITDDIGGSGSTDRTFSLMVTGNCISAGDVMDTLLDPNQYPHWSGDRIAKLKHWPKERDGLWQQYADLRRGFDRSDPGGRQRAVDAANQFYIEHQDAMDAGGAATWEHAWQRGHEFNALHSAMNSWIDLGDASFASECQQQPLGSEADGVDVLQIPAHCFDSKRTNLERGVCPGGCEAVTAAIDVQQDVLYWLALAWMPDGSASIVDYGTWPDQQVVMFNLRTLRRTLRQHYPGRDIPGAIYAGLSELIAALISRRWVDVGGNSVPLTRLLVDTGFETATAYSVIEQCGYPTVVIPCHGRGITARQKPFAEYRHEDGQQLGEDWRYRRPTGRATRAIECDANRWKTNLYRRMEVERGDPGSLTIFGNSQFPHNLIEDHLQNESGHRKSDGGRVVFEWSMPTNKPDQHWLDCLTMALVAASFDGRKAGGRRHKPPTTAASVDVVELARARGLGVQPMTWDRPM